MSEMRPIITIGFDDKYGGYDFRIKLAALENISVEQMKELRSTLMVSYAELEKYWHEYGPPSRDFAVAQEPPK